MGNSLFFCDCRVSSVYPMFITACMEETDSTDAQRKLFVFLLSSEKSIPLSSFLSFFVPVSGAGFPLMKKN